MLSGACNFRNGEAARAPSVPRSPGSLGEPRVPGQFTRQWRSTSFLAVGTEGVVRTFPRVTGRSKSSNRALEDRHAGGSHVSTPEEFGLSFAQGVGQGVGETAGSRLRARGVEKDRRRSDQYNRTMRAIDEETATVKERGEAFNAAIRAGRAAYALWCQQDNRKSIADNDPFILPEELDTEDWEIQHAREQHRRFRDAVAKLDEVLDDLVPWYAALPEWTVDQDPTREQLTTLIRDLENTRDARQTDS